MPAQRNTDLVKQIYAAIGKGDIPSVLGAMAENVEIRFPGPTHVPFAGTFRGRSGASDFFGAIGTNVDVHEFEPREFIEDGDLVVVLGHERLTARSTGRSWETDWAMAWTVRDGRISLVREFHQTDAIAAAFAPR
jgi:uncharacterized protein